MYARLLALLLSFLTLAAAGEGGEGGVEGEGGGAGGDAGGGDDAAGGEEGGDESGEEGESLSLDEMLEEEEPAAPARRGAREPEETPRERSARERAERAERDLDETRRRTPQTGNVVDLETQREEEQIQRARAGGASEDQMRWLQWSINQQRETREARRESQAALMEAREIQDRTAFEKLEITKPKTYKRYATRIENAITDMKSKGQTPLPRMALLRFFLGDDLMKDDLKLKPGKKTAAAGGGDKSVNRGKMPNARSDTNARGGGGKDERAKLRARLENVPI